MKCYYDSHTSFPINDFTSETFLSLQRLPKHYKRNMIKSIFFSTQGKASRGKLKHKRKKSTLCHYTCKNVSFPLNIAYIFSSTYFACLVLFSYRKMLFLRIQSISKKKPSAVKLLWIKEKNKLLQYINYCDCILNR